MLSPLNSTMTTFNESLVQNSTPRFLQEPSSYGKYGELERYTEFWVGLYLNRYYLRILASLGVMCNGAVFITIYTIKPFSTPSFYVAFLAIVDALALVMKLLYIELTRVMSLGSTGCKVMLFFGNFSVQYANWVLVIMTMERFVAVWFPLKVNIISTMTKAKVSLCISAVLLAGFNAHFLWTFHANTNSMKCEPREQYAEFIANIWPWLDGCVFGLFPCLLLIIPNGLIIYNVRRAIAAQKLLTSAECGSSHRNYHQTQLTVMLVTVAVAFVCCLLPGSIFFIVKPYWNISESVHERAKYQMVNQIMFLLTDCNHAMNFFFFFLGGKRFREMFLDIICCRVKKRRQARHSVVSQISLKTSVTSIINRSSSSVRRTSHGAYT